MLKRSIRQRTLALLLGTLLVSLSLISWRSYRDAPEIDGLVQVNGNISPREMVLVRVTAALVHDLIAEKIK